MKQKVVGENTTGKKKYNICIYIYGCFQKCGYPKMDGLFHGKPYEQMDDLGCFPPIFGNTHICLRFFLLVVLVPLFQAQSKISL